MNRLLLGLGVLAVVVGLGVVVEPRLLTVLPSLSSSAVVVIGLLSLFEAIRAGYSRRLQSVTEPSVPDPERRLVSTVPGSGFDERLSAEPRSRHALAHNREQMRDRLAETAVAVLVRYDGDTPERARERLRTGEWTDDRAAAAFFAPGVYRPPLPERVGQVLAGTDVFRTRAQRAIAVLGARAARPRTEEQNER